MSEERNLEAVMQKCRDMGFSYTEREGTAVLWWYTYEHYGRFHEKPSADAKVLYNDLRNIECYNMCEIRIKRINDKLHETKK